MMIVRNDGGCASQARAFRVTRALASTCGYKKDQKEFASKFQVSICLHQFDSATSHVGMRTRQAGGPEAWFWVAMHVSKSLDVFMSALISGITYNSFS